MIDWIERKSKVRRGDEAIQRMRCDMKPMAPVALDSDRHNLPLWTDHKFSFLLPSKRPSLPQTCRQTNEVSFTETWWVRPTMLLICFLARVGTMTGLELPRPVRLDQTAEEAVQ